MVIELTEQQEAIVRRIGEQEGKSPADVLVDAARWLETAGMDASELRLLDERLAEADGRPEWVTHQAVGDRVRMMLQRG